MPFVFVVKTDNTGPSDDTQFTIPSQTFSTSYNYTVTKVSGPGDLVGDPVSHNTNNTALTLDFTVAGTYELSLTGTFRGMRFANGGDKLKLLEIKEWGPFEKSTGAAASNFYGCENLVVTATDVPGFLGTTMLEMFRSCTSLVTIPNLGDWPTSNVTTFNYMFGGCSSFTGVGSNIGKMDVSAATDLGTIFAICTSFDQDISDWDVSGVSVWGAAFGSPATPTSGNVSFSPLNFNKILYKWSLLPLQTERTVFFGQSTYDIGGNAEVSLSFLQTPVLQQACTFDNGTNTITSAGHGLVDDNVITFTTTDTLPAEISENVRYWVINSDTDTFQISSEKDGSAITFTDNGIGTHTVNGGFDWTITGATSTGEPEAPDTPQYIFTNSTPVLDVDSNPVEGARVVIMRYDVLNGLAAGEVDQSDIILAVAVTNSSGNFTVNVTDFANFADDQDYIGICYKDGDPVIAYIPIIITPVSDQED